MPFRFDFCQGRTWGITLLIAFLVPFALVLASDELKTVRPPQEETKSSENEVTTGEKAQSAPLRPAAKAGSAPGILPLRERVSQKPTPRGAHRQSPERNPDIFYLPEPGLRGFEPMADVSVLKGISNPVLRLESQLFDAPMGLLVPGGNIASGLTSQEIPERKPLSRQVKSEMNGQLRGALLGVHLYPLRALLTVDNWGETNLIEPSLLTLENDRYLTGSDPLAWDVESGIGGALAALGDFHAARDQLHKSYDYRKKVLGKDHPLTLQAAQSLARVGRGVHDRPPP